MEYSKSNVAALELMKQKLAGTEKDSDNLARMLLDLGINPGIDQTTTPTNNTRADAASKSPVQDLDNAQKPKSVRFSQSLNNLNNPSSILKKKSTIEPLKFNLDANKDENTEPSATKAPENYQSLVTRLCKTESIMQSLKLSMKSMQSSHSAAEKEKNFVINKLKDRIREQEQECKKMEEAVSEARRSTEECEQRRRDAQAEVEDVHDKLRELTDKFKASTCDEERLHSKYHGQLQQLRREISSETEIRLKLEESHRLMVQRLHDMEQTLGHERAKNSNLSDEVKVMKAGRESFTKYKSEWDSKVKDMEQTLAFFKDELGAKEEAIRRLVEEQHSNEKNSGELSHKMQSLSKELEQCNAVLELQKASVAETEAQNEQLRRELDDERFRCQELADEKRREKGDDEKKAKEEKMRAAQIEERVRGEMRQALRREERKSSELASRIEVLEDCIRKQEACLQERSREQEEKDAESDQRLFDERKRTSHVARERDDAAKRNEHVTRELNRAIADAARENEAAMQRVEEAKLEVEAVRKERWELEEENRRLMSRIGAVEQQEQAYKRVSELAAATNSERSQLAYDNGKLQTRVEQLEEELRALASTQSQLIQLRTSNRAMEGKYQQLSSELAQAKVENNRMVSHVQQLQGCVTRKDADFNLAIAARDDACREKDATLAQLDALKSQEKSKWSQLELELRECRDDNQRLSATVDDVTERQARAQRELHTAQTQLGKRDAQLAAITEENEKLSAETARAQAEARRAHQALCERDDAERDQIEPALEALERARRENVKLSASLEDVLRANSQLKDENDRLQTDVEIQRERCDDVERRHDVASQQHDVTARNHAERIEQIHAQHRKEKDAIKRQLKLQIGELKKSSEQAQARSSQLAKGNGELRSKLNDSERTVERLKEKARQHKMALDRHQAERKSKAETEQKIKAIDVELNDLERAKVDYMRKNQEQAKIISTFNCEMASLKDDIVALSQAQVVSRDKIHQLEAQLRTERGNRQTLVEKAETLDGALKRALNEKQKAEEKLQKVQVESVQVQRNLQEAQSWFQDKFKTLRDEIATEKA